MVTAFPIKGHVETGHLVIVHDLAFAERRAATAKVWSLGAVLAVALIGAALASLTVLMIGRNWMRSVRQAMKTSAWDANRRSTRTICCLHARSARFCESLARRAPRRTARKSNGTRSLATQINTELQGAQIIVASNREPYIHNHEEGGVALQIPASGLVAALEPLMKACGGTWIAHGSGSADRETVDSEDHIAVPPEAPKYVLRRVWLTDEEQEGYY